MVAEYVLLGAINIPSSVSLKKNLEHADSVASRTPPVIVGGYIIHINVLDGVSRMTGFRES